MTRALLLLTLFASLAANAWFITRPQRVENPPPPVRASPEPIVAAGKPAAVAPVAWTDVDLSTDDGLRTMRSNLETLGLPPDVLRAALMVMVHRSFNQRREALMPKPKPHEYWRTRSFHPDAETLARVRELEREQRKLARELVGDDFDFEGNGSTQRRYGNIPAEKIAKLQKIFADYSDLEEQLFTNPAERGSADNRARAELLGREKRADIERLLTPEELLEYDLRNHPAAHRLRGRLGQFEVSEAEFLALYPIFKAATADEPKGPVIRVDGAEMRRAKAAADAKLDLEVRRVLGETRYAELKDANDHLLRETRAFTASIQLPAVVADEVVAIQKEFSAKLGAVDRDRDLTANQRDATASALGLEARERLIRVLGEPNFELYKRRGGGWLGAAIGRRPPTPTPAP